MRTLDSVRDRIKDIIPFQSQEDVVHTVLESIRGTENICLAEKDKSLKWKSNSDIFLIIEIYNEEKQEPPKLSYVS